MAAGSSDEAKLRMWVRAGLNEGCLGARLLALRMSWELYDQWYDRYSSESVEAWPPVPVSCLPDGTKSELHLLIALALWVSLKHHAAFLGGRFLSPFSFFSQLHLPVM